LKEVFASTILGGEGFIKDIQGKYLAEAGKNRNVPALTELAVRENKGQIYTSDKTKTTSKENK
jgi:hypothetical protein